MSDLTVDHLNHNKRDCSLKNLEWCTSEENTARARNDMESSIYGVAVKGKIFTSPVSFANWVTKEQKLSNKEANLFKKKAKKEWEKLIYHAQLGDFDKSSEKFYGLSVMAVKL